MHFFKFIYFAGQVFCALNSILYSFIDCIIGGESSDRKYTKRQKD